MKDALRDVVLILFSSICVFGCATKQTVVTFNADHAQVKPLRVSQQLPPSLWQVKTLAVTLPADQQNDQSSNTLNDGELKIYFFNVGQGDCTLVVCPNGKSILVDCGSTGGKFNAAEIRKAINNAIAPKKAIDLLVITHPDADHYNKIEAVLGQADKLSLDFKKVLMVGKYGEYRNSHYDFSPWLAALPKKKVEILDETWNANQAKSLSGFGSTKVQVLAANVGGNGGEKNARSIVLKITDGNIDIMLPGDATATTDKDILERFASSPIQLDVDVWKAAHHGSSATATADSMWANAIKPEVIIYSASINNTYGHPNRKLADKFISHTASAPTHRLKMWSGKNLPAPATPYQQEAMFLTATNGDIVLTSNGMSYQLAYKE